MPDPAVVVAMRQFKAGLLVDEPYCDELLTRLDSALAQVEREQAS